VSFDDEGRGLTTGACWRAKVRGPLLYTVAFELTLHDVADGSSVRASIGGDISGHADLALEGARSTELDLSWELRSDRLLLRVLDRAVPWATSWAHDRVVDACLGRFVRAVEAEPQPA
jgi:hypothetical protein